MRSLLLNAGSAVRLRAGFAYFSVVVLTACAAFCQNPVLKTRTKEEREQLYMCAHRITLNIQVTDTSGNPVSDLRAADFSIFDNEQPRKIAAFHAIDGAAMYDATRVVILLDAVNSPTQALEAGKNGIFKYLAESRKPFRYPTSFVLWFNGHLQATPPTTDRNAVGRAFVKMTKAVHSNACGGDAKATEQKIAAHNGSEDIDPATCRAVHFKDSIAALDGIAQQQQGGGRTLLIWVGTGWPVLSNEEFQRLTPPQQRVYAQESVNLARDMRKGQVTLYSISPSDGTSRDETGAAESLVNVSTSAPSTSIIARRLAIHELSPRTGGRVMAASGDIAGDLGTCVRDAEWYYAVSFNAPPAQNGPGELHSLAIKVNRPGLQVRAMTGYYTEP